VYARRRGDRGQGQEAGGRSRSAGRWFREPLTVTDLMTRDVKTVPVDASVADVATLMRDEDVGVVPVVDESGALAGIITDRDIVIRALAGPNATPAREQRALDLASRDVDAVSPRDSISSVLELMGRRQIRRAPVIGENRRLVGMISLGDIASRADYDEELQEALQEISARRSFWSRIWR
jgi:CBS domain-containing protein